MRKPILIILLLLIISISSFAVQENDSTASYIRNYTPQEYDAGRQNWAIIQDKREIMYFGNSDGVLEFDGTSWRLIPLPDGSGAYSLAINQEGRIYVGGQGELGYLASGERGIMYYTSLREKIPEEFQSNTSEIFDIKNTSEGVVFLSNKLMYLYKDDTISVSQSDDYFFSSVYANQTLHVIDGAKGLLRLENGRLITLPGGSFFISYLMLPYQEKNVFIMIPDGRIVIYDSNYNATDMNAFTFLPEQDSDFFNELDVKCAAILKDGNIALGSIKKGCIIINPSGRIELQINDSNGLQCNDVYAVYTDDKGNIWLGLDNGISFISRSNIESNYYQQAASVGLVDTLSARDADTSETDVFLSYIRSVESIKDDSLIFGGTFHEEIGGVQVSDQHELMYLTFPYYYNAFRITYSSNNFKDIENTEYQTYLKGMDTDWMSWSDRTWREYTSLHWGKYTFHIRARNSRGEISSEATYSFRIKTPWYEAWWFYSIQIFALLLLLVMAGFLRYKGKAAKLSDNLTNISTIVMFKYVYMAIGPLIGMFAAGIAFFQVLMSIATGFAINPLQVFIRNTLDKITGVKTENETDEEIKLEKEHEHQLTLMSHEDESE
ncbi:MAG: triple tyrosine motif-containing protein [Candidatus Hatepunaea meridiana]|nr:triple tyrosine motif-containing protein [Candidatus Hatepunaea meridiana]